MRKVYAHRVAHSGARAFAVLGSTAMPEWRRGGRPGRLLDGFETLAAWTADASDGVKASARSTDGRARARFAPRLRSRTRLPATPSCVASCRSICRKTSSSRSGCGRRRRQTTSRSSSPTPAETMSGGLSAKILCSPASGDASKSRRRQIAFAWGPTQDRTLRRIDSDGVRGRAPVAAAATARSRSTI